MRIRISSGKLKGRFIYYDNKLSFAPITTLLRESIMDSIRPFVADKVVLDIFAGTGIIGIDALSNAAAHAYFIEKNSQISNALQTNLNKLGINNAQVSNISFEHAFSVVSSPINIIFADPPFVQSPQIYDKLFALIGNNTSKLSQNAHIYIKHPALLDLLPLAMDLQQVKTKRRGNNAITHFITK